MKKKQLIVNADDFGRTAEINAGIEMAFREGILSSTTVVANSPAFESGLDILRRNSGLGVGIHLTVNEYPPMQDLPFLHYLRGQNHLQMLVALARAGHEEIDCLRNELRLQIKKVLNHGIKPTHLDGHGHCHLQPRLIPLVCDVAEEFGIRRARLPRESLLYPSAPARMVQKWVLNAMCARGTRVMRNRLKHPENFFGFTEGGNLTGVALNRILARLPYGVSELMCHVGTEKDDPPFHIGYHWENELQTLLSYNKKQLGSEFGIEVISYGELAT